MRLLIIALLFSFVLGTLASTWQIAWYKVGAIYLLGVLAAILIQRKPRPKAGVILQEIEDEINDNDQPVSSHEIMDYIKECKDYCLRHDI